MNIGIYVLVALVALALVVVKKTIVIIPQSETKIIERLGRYFATLKPGINVIIPFIDHAKDIVSMRNGRYVYTNSIDLREQVYDFDRQNVITKDNIQMQINALLYFQIVDPFKSVYEINNLPNAIGSLPISTKYLSSASLERLVILLLILSCLINILLPFYLEFFEVFLCIPKPPHGFGVQRYEKKCNYVVI